IVAASMSACCGISLSSRSTLSISCSTNFMSRSGGVYLAMTIPQCWLFDRARARRHRLLFATVNWLTMNIIRGPLGWVAAGGLLAGAFDIAYACIYWGIAADVPAQRIFQSVARGLLGKAAFEGGWGTALL